MNKISVLIPVYRESTLLERLLTDLLRDPYPSKEVLVVIDEPTEISLDVVERNITGLVGKNGEEEV